MNRKLLDRSENVITGPEDKCIEHDKIKTAFKRCGCPKWDLKKVKYFREVLKIKKNQQEQNKGKGNLVILFGERMSENISRTL